MNFTPENRVHVPKIVLAEDSDTPGFRPGTVVAAVSDLILKLEKPGDWLEFERIIDKNFNDVPRKSIQAYLVWLRRPEKDLYKVRITQTEHGAYRIFREPISDLETVGHVTVDVETYSHPNYRAGTLTGAYAGLLDGLETGQVVFINDVIHPNGRRNLNWVSGVRTVAQEVQNTFTKKFKTKKVGLSLRIQRIM